MKTNGRLNNILSLIPNDVEIIADIGCDHGKIIVSSVLLGKCKKGIAVDISESSLQKAKNLALNVDVYDKIDFVCGDGFKNIDNINIDVAIISGIGGFETVSIMNHKNCVSKFILCPHQNIPVLRKYLRENGFFVSHDYWIKENDKYYSLISTQKGVPNYSDEEIYLGKNFPPNNIFNERNLKRYEYLNKLVKSNGNIKIKNNELLEEYEVLKNWKNLLI